MKKINLIIVFTLIMCLILPQSAFALYIGTDNHTGNKQWAELAGMEYDGMQIVGLVNDGEKENVIATENEVELINVNDVLGAQTGADSDVNVKLSKTNRKRSSSDSFEEFLPIVADAVHKDNDEKTKAAFLDLVGLDLSNYNLGDENTSGTFSFYLGVDKDTKVYVATLDDDYNWHLCSDVVNNKDGTITAKVDNNVICFAKASENAGSSFLFKLVSALIVGVFICGLVYIVKVYILKK